MSKIQFINTLALPDSQRSRARGAFTSYLKRNGIAAGLPGGQVFALLDRGRVMGGIWLRTWPGHPRVGDVHAALARSRFSHFDTLFAFNAFLMEREKVMNLQRWRVILPENEVTVWHTLTYLGFVEVNRQSFPAVGDAVILEREVI